MGWAGTEARYRARNPAPHWGIGNTDSQQTPEWLKIRFDYGQSSYSELLSDLGDGDFRVAQHVTGMPESIWTVSQGPVDPVPLPASIWLLGSGLVGWAGASRFRKRA
ncbi:MAG: VPLPA-CTERM sorting domain-containing protein [Candidatus Eisenbacteria bacterium]